MDYVIRFGNTESSWDFDESGTRFLYSSVAIGYSSNVMVLIVLSEFL